ncbi:hypothetical protein AVEN_250972-1 [Araneus ventricosus]|uniref:CCHC-type domain-containing protein n=1 Tax=Araneus ventricosus TaxID=182803 RepID=A0A4Y2P5B3_ARAVE|nr:hypothetical protein AVEN_250972-1 [Araneus ventricosus]
MPSGLNYYQYRMASNVLHQSNAFSKFFIVSAVNGDLKNASPILIHKTIIAVIGDVKSIKKLHSGQLLIELMNTKQSENLLKLQKIGDIQIKVAPHHSLNHSKGVISESEFQRDLEDDILECLKDHKVIAVRRIAIKRNYQNFPTKHVILTFNTPVLPKSVKIAYMNCPVRHFIPNPLRCFKCQRFGHTITACRGKQICARCSLPDHDSNNCTSTTPKCYNCNGDHPAFFRSCPRYKQEKEILTVKITKNISFQEARKIINDRTPKPGISYSSALNSVVTPSCSQNMQFIPSITNTTTAPTTVTPPSDNDVITIKKSDWLSLLEIKKSLEKTFSSVSEACAVPPLVTTFPPTSACSTASNSECRTSAPIPAISLPSTTNGTQSNKQTASSNSNPSVSVTASSDISVPPKSIPTNKPKNKKDTNTLKQEQPKVSKKARVAAQKKIKESPSYLINRLKFQKKILKISKQKQEYTDESFSFSSSIYEDLMSTESETNSPPSSP